MSSQLTKQTRNEFLASLTRLATVPKNVADECVICFDDTITDPVQLSCSHVFCEECITSWCSRKGQSCNACPTCRRTLFNTSADFDRAPAGSNRLQVAARALEHSGLLTDDQFNVYSDVTSFSLSAIHRAAAAAHLYLVEESHPPTTGPVLIEFRVLGPALLAMGNLLRGYARATGRSYSGYQHRDWKLIIRHLEEHLLFFHGQVRESGVGMAREFSFRVQESLSDHMIDVNSGRFFESGASLQSPSGDLDVLLNYMVFVCAKAYQDRKGQKAALKQAQRDALDRESTKIGYFVRKTTQTIFGLV